MKLITRVWKGLGWRETFFFEPSMFLAWADTDGVRHLGLIVIGNNIFLLPFTAGQGAQAQSDEGAKNAYCRGNERQCDVPFHWECVLLNICSQFWYQIVMSPEQLPKTTTKKLDWGGCLTLVWPGMRSYVNVSVLLCTSPVKYYTLPYLPMHAVKGDGIGETPVLKWITRFTVTLSEKYRDRSYLRWPHNAVPERDSQFSLLYLSQIIVKLLKCLI